MGKKYIIELEDKPFHKDGDFLYRVKGFNSLVFDMTGIGKLAPYHEPDLGLLAKENFERGYRQRKAEDEKDLEQVREEAYEDGYKTAKVQCNIQAEKDMREVGERHYQHGLNDAWEAARKILKADGFTCLKLFGDDDPTRVIKNFTASEAIEKIRQYEQEKEEKQHTWICSEAGEPSTDITLICSKCGYTITIKPGDTQALNFCPKCGDNKRGERDE